MDRRVYILLNVKTSAGLAMGIWADGVDEAMTPYTTSKQGVVAMTRSMALGPKGNIMHKALCPDTTDTELVAEAGKGLSPKALKEDRNSVWMSPEFVAEVQLVMS